MLDLVSVQILCPFLIDLSVIIELEEFFIPDTNPLSVICFANIFSQSVVCVFIFLPVPLEEQKFLILVKANIIMFFISFMDCTVYLI